MTDLSKFYAISAIYLGLASAVNIPQLADRPPVPNSGQLASGTTQGNTS